MKGLLRNLLINLAALWVTSRLIPGLEYHGGLKALIIGAIGLMLLNILVIPLLKVMFLPLNLLTLGIFAWLVNVVGLYLLTSFLPFFTLIPYAFSGYTSGGFVIPASNLSVLQVAILASLSIGFISHFLIWLSGK